MPKVIDFGIAKASGQRLTDKTVFTHFHAFIGTPAYTSPEQAEMGSVDIDTHSDIHSLGVLLYELLTGKTPFDGEELRRFAKAGWHQRTSRPRVCERVGSSLARLSSSWPDGMSFVRMRHREVSTCRMNFPLAPSNLLSEARMAVTPEQLYEQTLVIRSQVGDEAAFAELLTLHGPRLLLFTQRMMQSSPEQVADATQEIWVAIFRALPGLRDASKFRPWAFRIARDRNYREYRRRKPAWQQLPEAELEELPAGEDVLTMADKEQLHSCLDSISPEHREALVLRFFEELSYEDIARVTSASVGTIRSRIYYGKRALRAAWEGKTS